MQDNNNARTTILVVDDVNDNLVVMQLTLQEMGYRVITADNGEDALTVALVEHPNLILMDIAMPRLDGLGATRRIRTYTELQHVPIIAFTAFDTEGFRRAAFDAGFDGFLTKPVNFERLRNLISMLLSKADMPVLAIRS